MPRIQPKTLSAQASVVWVVVSSIVVMRSGSRRGLSGSCRPPVSPVVGSGTLFSGGGRAGRPRGRAGADHPVRAVGRAHRRVGRGRRGPAPGGRRLVDGPP